MFDLKDISQICYVHAPRGRQPRDLGPGAGSAPSRLHKRISINYLVLSIVLAEGWAVPCGAKCPSVPQLLKTRKECIVVCLQNRSLLAFSLEEAVSGALHGSGHGVEDTRTM